MQATLNAFARSQDLSVGAAILTGIKAKLIDALETGRPRSQVLSIALPTQRFPS